MIEKVKSQKESISEYTKMQLELALFEIQNLQQLTQRTDTKAQFILGANAVLITVIVALFPDVRNVFISNTLPVVRIYSALLIGFAVATLLSIVTAYFVVKPAPPPRSVKDKVSRSSSLFYFREIARSNIYRYIDLLSNFTPEDIFWDLGLEIYGLSSNANKKYNMLDRSIKLLTISVIFWILILLNTLVLSL